MSGLAERLAEVARDATPGTLPRRLASEIWCATAEFTGIPIGYLEPVSAAIELAIRAALDEAAKVVRQRRDARRPIAGDALEAAAAAIEALK